MSLVNTEGSPLIHKRFWPRKRSLWRWTSDGMLYPSKLTWFPKFFGKAEYPDRLLSWVGQSHAAAAANTVGCRRMRNSAAFPDLLNPISSRRAGTRECSRESPKGT